MLDTIIPPEGMVLFPKLPPDPEKKLTIPVEDIKDERRKFDDTIGGFQMIGPLAFVPLLGRHLPKSIIWKIQDISKRRKIIEIKKNNFNNLNEKELRLMILTWRDGLLNPFKLSKRDRSFLAESKSDKIMTNKKYLDEMEKRGFVSSLLITGQIFYRANFSRLEILQSFIKAFCNIDEYNEKDTILKYIELINSCYDISKNKIIIPE